MNRDLAVMSAKHYDVAIIGGGVTGAAIAWDASLRGMRVALIEAYDYGWAASAHNSRLIHGGLRYLAQGEMKLVRESLCERALWLANAPHQVSPLEFLMPIYDTLGVSTWKLRAGLTLYDWLARRGGARSRLPGHKRLARQAVLKKAPWLRAEGLTGGFTYYDCRMRSPERLVLEMVLGAAEHGAHAANYVSAEALERGEDGRIAALKAQDAFSGETAWIRARCFINAAGPWADAVAGLGSRRLSERTLTLSKGVHIQTSPKPMDFALAVQSPDGGHVFVLPQDDHCLIGTTDTPYEGDPAECAPTAADVGELLDRLETAAGVKLFEPSDIRGAYAGLRTLYGADGRNDTYKASRQAEIIDHEADGEAPGLISVIGGKWTTSRALAERAVDLVQRKLDLKSPCRTRAEPLPGARREEGTGWREEAKRLYDGARRDPTLSFGEETLRAHLACYGARAQSVWDIARASPRSQDPLTADWRVTGADVMHAIEREQAMTLEDVIVRRTLMAQSGQPTIDDVFSIAHSMRELLGWDESDFKEHVQIAAAVHRPTIMEQRA